MKKRWVVPVVSAAAAAAVYAAFVEPRWLEVRRTRIHLRGLPQVLDGLRIALLTDLHAGGATPLSVVRRAASLAMSERPDMIAITGDFAVDWARSFDPVLGALSTLSAPLGVYAVPGNHDHVIGIGAWHDAVARHHNIIDVTNSYAIHKVLGANICIAGVDDLYEGNPKLTLPPKDSRDVTILLAHTPDQAEYSRREIDDVDLIVSGHTHAGQVRLPFIGAPITSNDFPELYQEGLRRRPWTQVYTSRGVGTVGVPFRFGARPEVSLLELTSRPRPAGNEKPASVKKMRPHHPRRGRMEAMSGSLFV